MNKIRIILNAVFVFVFSFSIVYANNLEISTGYGQVSFLSYNYIGYDIHQTNYKLESGGYSLHAEVKASIKIQHSDGSIQGFVHDTTCILNDVAAISLQNKVRYVVVRNHWHEYSEINWVW